MSLFSSTKQSFHWNRCGSTVNCSSFASCGRARCENWNFLTLLETFFDVFVQINHISVQERWSLSRFIRFVSDTRSPRVAIHHTAGIRNAEYAWQCPKDAQHSSYTCSNGILVCCAGCVLPAQVSVNIFRDFIGAYILYSRRFYDPQYFMYTYYNEKKRSSNI